MAAAAAVADVDDAHAVEGIVAVADDNDLLLRLSYDDFLAAARGRRAESLRAAPAGSQDPADEEGGHGNIGSCGNGGLPPAEVQQYRAAAAKKAISRSAAQAQRRTEALRTLKAQARVHDEQLYVGRHSRAHKELRVFVPEDSFLDTSWQKVNLHRIAHYKALYLHMALVERSTTLPAFERFSVLCERLVAAICGARLRRCLQSPQVQSLIVEIQDIVLLLTDLQDEAAAGLLADIRLAERLALQLTSKRQQLDDFLEGRLRLPTSSPARPRVPRRSNSDNAAPEVVASTPSVSDSVRSFLPRRRNSASAHNFNSVATAKPVPWLSMGNAHHGIAAVAAGDAPSVHYAAPAASSKHPPEGSTSLTKLAELNKSVQQQQAEVLRNMESQERPALADTSNMPASTPQQSHVPPIPRTTRRQGESSPKPPPSVVPSRPFLRRKSQCMPQQKLDWSKVKPVVQCHLEDHLVPHKPEPPDKSKPPTRTMKLSQVVEVSEVLHSSKAHAELQRLFAPSAHHTRIPQLRTDAPILVDYDAAKYTKSMQALQQHGLQHGLTFVHIPD
eukprot:jgi/Chlat1/6218/Chrsp44S05749